MVLPFLSMWFGAHYLPSLCSIALPFLPPLQAFGCAIGEGFLSTSRRPPSNDAVMLLRPVVTPPFTPRGFSRGIGDVGELIGDAANAFLRAGIVDERPLNVLYAASALPSRTPLFTDPMNLDQQRPKWVQVAPIIPNTQRAIPLHALPKLCYRRLPRPRAIWANDVPQGGSTVGTRCCSPPPRLPFFSAIFRRGRWRIERPPDVLTCRGRELRASLCFCRAHPTRTRPELGPPSAGVHAALRARSRSPPPSSLPPPAHPSVRHRTSIPRCATTTLPRPQIGAVRTTQRLYGGQRRPAARATI